MTWRDPFYPGDDLINEANSAIDLRREVERLRAALRDIQFIDCCYDCRVIADEALGDDG